jgi:repressor LexA
LGAFLPRCIVTHKQQIVLDFVRQFMAEHRQGPLIREIQAGCQIASYKSAVDRLNALERRGFIKRTPNKHRGIRLLRRLEASAAQSPPGVDAASSAQDPEAATVRAGI